MGYIQGDGRHQGTLFPVTLDDLVPADHVCRIIGLSTPLSRSSTWRSLASNVQQRLKPDGQAMTLGNHPKPAIDNHFKTGQ